MPELPEVETVRRGLEAEGLAAQVRGVWRSGHALRTGAHWDREHEKLRRLRGCTPTQISRRGKYLLWDFNKARGGAWTLLIHLGMTGKCEVTEASRPRAKHVHFELSFADGRQFRFTDARRFGALQVATRSQLLDRKPLCGLGPEPLGSDFDGAALQRVLGKSDRALRDGLLDQRAVAGIGNIYASEICFRVAIDPRIACRRLRAPAFVRVAAATREVLGVALSRGGTTLRDYRKVDGSLGENQFSLMVYGREAQACRACGTQISSAQHQGRSLFWCPSCQARPKGRWI